MVDLHLSRQLTNSFASGSAISTGVELSEKKPGSAFAYSVANSGEPTHSRNTLA